MPSSGVAHWNHNWHQLFECRQTKHFFPDINQKLSKGLLKFSRKKFSILVQLITGHNFLNRHNSIVLNQFSQYDDSGCRYCDENEESSFHIFARCERFAEDHRRWFDQPFLDHTFDVKAKDIMGFLRDAKIEELTNLD